MPDSPLIFGFIQRNKKTDSCCKFCYCTYGLFLLQTVLNALKIHNTLCRSGYFIRIYLKKDKNKSQEVKSRHLPHLPWQLVFCPRLLSWGAQSPILLDDLSWDTVNRNAHGALILENGISRCKLVGLALNSNHKPIILPQKRSIVLGTSHHIPFLQVCVLPQSAKGTVKPETSHCRACVFLRGITWLK